MKVSFSLSCLLLLAGALSMGCVAQAGTDVDPSEQSEQGLTYAAPLAQQQASPKERIQHVPHVLNAPVRTTELPQGELKELSGIDPSGNVQDDGDGKEPDPHPWHVDTALASP